MMEEGRGTDVDPLWLALYSMVRIFSPSLPISLPAKLALTPSETKGPRPLHRRTSLDASAGAELARRRYPRRSPGGSGSEMVRSGPEIFDTRRLARRSSSPLYHVRLPCLLLSRDRALTLDPAGPSYCWDSTYRYFITCLFARMGTLFPLVSRYRASVGKRTASWDGYRVPSVSPRYLSELDVYLPQRHLIFFLPLADGPAPAWRRPQDDASRGPLLAPRAKFGEARGRPSE